MQEKKTKRKFWEMTKRFLEPLSREKVVTFRAVIVYFLWAIGTIYHVYFIQKLVFYLENHNKAEFLKFIVIYATFNILYEILSFLTKNWGWVITVNSYRSIIHKEYLKRFVWLWNTETEKIGTGKLISIIDKWMDIWSQLLDQLLVNGIAVIVAFLFSLYTVLYVNIIYGVIFLVAYISLHILWWYVNRFTIQERRKRQENWNLYIKQLVKIIMSKFEILQTSKIWYEINRLDQISNELVVCNYTISKYVHLFYRIPEWFITWSKFAILLYLWLEILDGRATFSTFIWVFWVFTVLDSAISNSMTFYKDFTHNFTSVEKLWDFFDTTPEIHGYETGKDFVYKNGEIELKNISFRYGQNKKVFENFSLNISGGKITALVGNSWWGKTTLVKIISQYIKQDTWVVAIDKQNLGDISLKSYYKNIWYLTQEPSVFDGTILDNLTYALEEDFHCKETRNNWLSDKMKNEINEIIKLSKCEFIHDFAEWWDTEIGERWVRLSWWQKQRLAIAKIMLKNPRIIILDEPTSALDSFSEELITKAMNNLFKGRTVLVIAHRLQTVKHADEIIVIENGEIAERGNHQELIAKNGIYNRMLELQSGF